MENNEYFANPNSNADIYRNMTQADRPPVPDKHLQFISTYNDEKVILGGSNLTDRYWYGTVWYFENTSEINRKKSFATSRTNSTVRDAVFVEDNKFILAQDGGIIQLFSVLKPPEIWSVELQCAGFTCQHDDNITSLAVFESKTHFLTAGMDCCLKVWQTSTLLAECNYSTAHTDIITGVDVLSKHDSLFVSCSMDSEATIWDIRLETPAKRLYKIDGNIGFTAISWNSVKEHEVAIGGEDGVVYLMDIRKPDDLMIKSLAFPRSIYRLKFHPHRNNWIAGCCDDTTVKVLDTSQDLQGVYQDNSHADFVRGLSWLKDELLTCSWDDTIVRHNITSSSVAA